MVNTYQAQVEEAAAFLRAKVEHLPSVMLALSGGVEKFVDDLTDIFEISTTDIPHFPRSQAEGHRGSLVFGSYEGRRVVVSLGRVHYYEGITLQQVTFPMHVMNAIGVKTLINTNAVGGIRNDLDAGDLMLIRDHINFLGDNPLRGVAIHTDYQFPDMTNAYCSELRGLAQQVAAEQDLPLTEGVYMAATGPCYETPAEIHMMRGMGADTIGMSTVPEVIVANFHRMRVLAICCIANPSADRHEGEMSHQLVLEAMREIEPRLLRLVQGVVTKLDA